MAEALNAERRTLNLPRQRQNAPDRREAMTVIFLLLNTTAHHANLTWVDYLMLHQQGSVGFL
jgi:hypothetical protein